MDYARLPDWLIYLAASAAVLVAAVSRQEHADTAEAPPPPPGAERVPLGPDSPFDPATVIRTGAHKGQHRGTAFAVAEGGVWLTASSEVAGCRHVALKVAEGRAVGARVQASGDPAIVILRTAGGPSPMTLKTGGEPGDGERAFLIGFPRGDPGEATVLRMTQSVYDPAARSILPGPAQIWSETGRTENMKGDLPGLAGAPVLDASGHVTGMVLAGEARRARFYSTSAEALSAALAKASVRPQVAAPGETITVANYGRAADKLRFERRVAQVLCLLG